MFKYYNPNPMAARVGDCAVRAVSKATNQSWEKTYLELALYGYMLGDMPSANAVWGRYLHDKGFVKEAVPYRCPDCYTVGRFAEEHSEGVYVAALAGHVVTVDSGCIYDSWNSTDEVVLYVWRKT